MKTQEVIGAPLALTKEEHELLIYIYQKRLRFFILVYLFLTGVAFTSALSIDGREPRSNYLKHISYRYSERDTGFSRMQMYAITITLLEGFVIGTAIFIYRKRVGPLRRDAKNGIKEAVYYPVIRKQDFQQTGQYFIGTDHPDYLFHEVDYETWQQVNVGDNFAVYRAPLSKYVFNKNGKYAII